tara:strand:+ start:226 stop:618 length:393 start_codon:yes stop_codon:yes gene_type:complete
MSTLKVNTIQDTSGGSSSTPAEIKSGRAKVWVTFTGQSSASIQDSFGVSSVARRSNGNYTVNFSTSFSDTNYGVVATVKADRDSWADGDDSCDSSAICLNQATSYTYIGSGDFDDGAPDDVDRMTVVCYS